MSDLDSRIPYWDAAATTKTFTHPLHLPWLDGIGGHAVILDYGCGYGRVETVDTRTITVSTMNGHGSKGIQILARRPVENG